MIENRLRCLRQQVGYSQKQMADALCVDRSTYAYYEMGKLNLSIPELKKLSAIFNVSVDELVK